MLVSESKMNFNYDDAEAVPLSELSETGMVESVVGKVRLYRTQ